MPEQFCLWTQDSVYGVWNTDCGAAFDFDVDGPSENGFKYCFNCGKPIQQEDGADE